MSSSNNCFEDLISSFKTICSELENKAEFNLKQAEKQCEDDFSSNLKSLRDYNEIMANIGETCLQIVKNSEILRNVTASNNSENFINLPYDLHSDTVKCFNELFNMTPMKKSLCTDKLIDEGNEESLSEFIKICEKNIRDVKDIENTLIEAKDLF